MQWFVKNIAPTRIYSCDAHTLVPVYVCIAVLGSTYVYEVYIKYRNTWMQKK